LAVPDFGKDELLHWGTKAPCFKTLLGLLMVSFRSALHKKAN
jgi:hypothetical protein